MSAKNFYFKSTLGQQQQQQQRLQQQHYTTRKTQSAGGSARQHRESEIDKDLDKIRENWELVSAHSKVDQWLLEHFKLTVEANAGDLQTLTSVESTGSSSRTTSSNANSFKQSITTLHIPTPKLASLQVAANDAAIIIPKLSRPITTQSQDYFKSTSVKSNTNSLIGYNNYLSMTTTNLENQGHSEQESTQPPANTQNLDASSQLHTHISHYQKNQPSLQSHHPLINPFKMDAGFWQHARGASFGLHAALSTNNMPHHTQTTHMQHQQHQHQQHHHQTEHHLSEQLPTTQVHMNQNTSTIQQDDTTAIADQQQQHQHHHHQHHTHHQQQLHHHHHLEEQQIHPHSHLTHLGAEQSHHLLFNAAAAAAAAAHLSGVVKSNEMSEPTVNDNKTLNINNNNNNNNNSSCNNNNSDNNDQNKQDKQEPHATNGGSSNNLSVYVSNNATNVNSNNNTQPHSQHVVNEQDQQQHQAHMHQQHSLKFEQEAQSPGSLPLEVFQHQIQQQMHQQKHAKSSLRNSHDNQKPEAQLQQQHHQQHHPHNLHTQQQPPVNPIDKNSTQPDPQQVTTTTPLAPNSPLRINALAHHQTPTSSPQPSLTSPSAGSSTPDLKFSSDNNKLPNELQLQLSRSNSAAAISERTLEECWSTLQRLFMHKSAMQQMQQQIPRTGLGPTGTGSIGAESKPHQCQQCMKSFSSNHQLVQHIRVHTGEKPYKCSYCDRRFKQLSHVQQHTRLHTGERPYKCHLPECGRAFIQLSNLQQHLRNHDAQVERAKNRPFHCNICGKGFATESSLRTHTSKELQLHLGVLQQHAALIGGPNATSCPICHKLFLGTDALMEHMKHVHKEKSSQSNNNPFVESICGSVGNNLSNTGSTSCLQSSGASSSNDPYSAKRRTANHPCPVCGKHYVNEGSLRKHLACHAETTQLTNSLRMWPCSVCQAVFTYENGLLTHMEHMRMDPKHQFAAQYVLSRAAAERRDRDSILAATLAASSGSSGGGLMPLLGEGSGTGGGGTNSLCPSPSANSECSSNGRLSSSAASDPGSGINLLNSNNNNNNSTNNNNINNNSHINNNCSSSNSNLSLNNKLNDILRTGSNTNHTLCAPPHPNTHNSHQNHPHTISGHGYGSITGVDTDLQNRMSLMAAASAAAAAVAASANNTSVSGLPSPQRFGVDSTHTAAGSAAVQAAVVNLAAAMRLNHSSGGNSSTAGVTSNESALDTSLQQTHNSGQGQSNGSLNHSNGRTTSPVPQGLQTDTSTAVMNAMRDSMMRSSLMETSQDPSHHQHQLQQQTSGHTTSYGHTSNASMNQQASHHLSQQQQSQPVPHLQHLHHQQNSTASGGGTLQHLHQQHNHTADNLLQTSAPPPPSHSPETTLHMQHQAEAILRSHTEAAFRLAASVVQQQTNEISANSSNNNNNNNNDKLEQAQQQQQQTKNPLTEENSQQKHHLNQSTQDISEVIRLQEHRLEQALRLHNDARTFNFLNTSATQQQQQTTNLSTNHTNTNTTSNATQPPQQQHQHHTT